MKRFQSYLIPSLAILGAGIGLYIVFFGVMEVPPPPIPFPPPKSPYSHSVAGSGLVEASSLNIALGPTRNDIVSEIFVKPGDVTKKGAPLFALDSRGLEAQAKEAQARIDAASAKLDQLISQPRKEEIPPKQAEMRQAKSDYFRMEKELGFYNQIKDKRSISQNEYNSVFFSAKSAKQYYLAKKGELDLLLAGAWEKDIEISSKELLVAKAQLFTIQTEIDRSTIRAPIDGTVMQVNIRLGVAVNLIIENQPPILFGVTHPLNVRVDVDENDAWRVKKGAPAMGFVRGKSSINSPMEFVMIEPYIVPKQAFTGDSRERIDTRVLQVIYKIQDENLPVYPGQIMDVYIQAIPEANEEK